MIAVQSQECALQDQFKTTNTNDQCGLVKSGQTGVHPQLAKHVRRHLETPWSQPLHRPTVEAYRRLKNEGAFSTGRPFILDSGCGTGKSTRSLAALYPGHWVIGVDQSKDRLSRGGAESGFLRSDNYIMTRAELATFWRLLLADGYSPERHCLFYPNPWPKSGHLSRRWHGHPVFPQMLKLGGEIELRCNWKIYALEFAQAVTIATGVTVNVTNYEPENGITPFEQKYLERGQELFSVKVPALSTEP